MAKSNPRILIQPQTCAVLDDLARVMKMDRAGVIDHALKQLIYNRDLVDLLSHLAKDTMHAFALTTQRIELLADFVKDKYDYDSVNED